MISDRPGEVVKLDLSKSSRERFVYVIEFTSGTVKVGQTANPEKRLLAHKQGARAHGHAIARSWVSMPHVNYDASEQSLIAFCSARWSASSGHEYFAGAGFEQVVEYAKTLPFRRLTAEEEEQLTAREQKRAESFIAALKIGLGAPAAVSSILPSRLQLELGDNWYRKFTAGLAELEKEHPDRPADADDVALMVRRIFQQMSPHEYEDAINHLVIDYWVGLIEEEREDSLPLSGASLAPDELAALRAKTQLIAALVNDENRWAACDAFYDLLKETVARTPAAWATEDPTAAERYLVGRGAPQERAQGNATEFELNFRTLFLMEFHREAESFDEIARFCDATTGSPRQQLEGGAA